MKKYFVILFLACMSYYSHGQIVKQLPVTGNNYGGYIGCLDLEPGRPEHVLAAGGASGLWQSYDGGRTWESIHSLYAYRIVAVSFCPNDANVIIVTSRFDTRTNRASGIWRSTDKGITWTNIRLSELPPNESERCPVNLGAYSISWIPGTNSVIIGTDCGVAVSHDKGETWSDRLLIPNRAGSVPAPLTLPDQVTNVLAISDSRFFASTITGNFYTADAGTRWWPATNLPANSTGVACMTSTTPKILFYYGWNSSLYYSRDLGVTWLPIPTFGIRGNMPHFVKAISTPGENFLFDLYIGDGTNLFKLLLDARNTSGFATAEPVAIGISHKDPSDIVFHPATSLPYVLSNDGGIQKPLDEAGMNWEDVGGGRGGLNGLEVKGLAVQNTVGIAERQTDIYYATWHNEVCASLDGGITWGPPLTWEAANVEANGPRVTPSLARTSMHVTNWAENIYMRNYVPAAPLEPYYRPNTRGMYIRFLKKGSTESILAHIGNDFYFRPVSPSVWNNIYRFTPTESELYTINAPSFSNAPDGSLVIYQPFATNEFGIAGEKIRKLKKITVRGTAFLPRPVVERNPAMNGFSTLGQMQEYWEKAVFSSRPDDPRFLIAADVGAFKMKKSTDGGENWRPDETLTALLTDYGRLQFYALSPYSIPQARVISFNPYNTSEIYIGTEESGIIYSRTGGTSWWRIPGSEKIKLTNAIGYGASGMVYFGSSATGIWKFDSKKFVKYPFHFLNDTRILIRDRMSGAVVPIGDLGPDKCPVCRTYIVQNGSINNLETDASGNTTIHVTDLNSLYAYFPDTSSHEPLAFRQTAKFKSGVNPAIIKIERSGFIVKGIVVENGKIKAFITSERKMEKLPTTVLFSNEMLENPERESIPQALPAAGKIYSYYKPNITAQEFSPDFRPALKPGSTVHFYARGFESGNNTNAVIVMTGNVQTGKPINVDAKGKFAVEVQLPVVPGMHVISFSQQTKYGWITQKVIVEVANED